MIKIIIATTLIVSGCTVSGSEINRAQNLCKDHGGIRFIEGWPTSTGQVRCVDGLTISQFPK